MQTLDDGWTVVTADGSLSAQFEHTVLVTRDGFEILTQAPPEGTHVCDRDVVGTETGM